MELTRLRKQTTHKSQEVSETYKIHKTLSSRLYKQVTIGGEELELTASPLPVNHSTNVSHSEVGFLAKQMPLSICSQGYPSPILFH